MTSSLLQHLRTTLVSQAADMTDAELLDSFTARHDEAAFKALVLRYGPMVWGVCLRVLQNLHDAEDAFQATFLVLARKAARVKPRERVGHWLYGVAYRAALKARSRAARRRAKETQAAAMSRTQEPAKDTGHDLARLLDQEVQRLPPIYRIPVVLCDLQGKTRTEAARHLGWPEGTVAGRLARARAKLAKRLGRYGLATAGASLATGGAAAASPPALLVASTMKAVSLGMAPALVQGLVKAMVLHKVLKAFAFLLLITAFAAAGWYGYTAAGETPAAAGRGVGTTRHAEQAKSDLDRVQGTWRVVSSRVGGEKASAEEVRRRKVTVRGNVLTYDFGNERKEKREGTLNLDAKKKHLDWTWTSPEAGPRMLAIYDLKGDTWKIGFGNDGQVRPRGWVMGKDDVVWLLVLRREPVVRGGAVAEKETPLQKEWKRLEGTWQPVAYESEGQKAGDEEFKKLGFAGDVLIIRNGKCQVKSKAAALRIDPAAKPKTMTRTYRQGLVSHSIYEVKGDSLRICTNFENDQVPPKGFTAQGSFVLVYKRQKP